MSDVIKVPVRANGLPVFTLMDADDVERLGARKLSLGSHGYAQMWLSPGVALVHRWVLGLQRGDRRIGDHINGDRLDNRRANLRIVDASGSSQNVSGWGKSKYRGVYPFRRKWAAMVKFRGETYRLGVFLTEEAAAFTADQKRRELMPDYVGTRISPLTLAIPDLRTHADRQRKSALFKQIREWACANGFEVSDMGRIPRVVREAFEAAHPNATRLFEITPRDNT